MFLIRDYSPSYDNPSLSIAFDLSDGPKCWLSTSQVRPINKRGPSEHEDYRRFRYNGTAFYPYSIRSLGLEVFTSIDALKLACWTLYQHAVLD